MAAQLTGFMLSGPTLALSLPASAAVSGQPGAQHAGGQLQAAGFSIWLGQAQAASAGASSISQAGGESLPQDGMQLPPFPVKNGKTQDAADGRGYDLKSGNESGSATPGWLFSGNNLNFDSGESAGASTQPSDDTQMMLDTEDLDALLSLLSPQEDDGGQAASRPDAISAVLARLQDLLNGGGWQFDSDAEQLGIDSSTREKLAEWLDALSALLNDPDSEHEGKGADLLQALFGELDTNGLPPELTAEQLARIEVALQQLQQALQQALQAESEQADMIADGRLLAREALEKVLELLSERLAQVREQGEISRERISANMSVGVDGQAGRQLEAQARAESLAAAEDRAQAKAVADAVRTDAMRAAEEVRAGRVDVVESIKTEDRMTSEAARAERLSVTPPPGIQPDTKQSEMDGRSQASLVNRAPESLQSSSTPPPLHERQGPLPATPEQQNTDRARAAFTDQLLPQERGVDQKVSGEALKQSDVPQQSVRLESGLTSTPAQSTMAANSVPADATTAAKQAALAQQLQNPAWARAMGERAIMMTQQGPRFAEIRLDPPELGALKIRVHILPGDQVSLSFSSPNAAVRDALEQNMPRLREMFAEQGLNLMDSSVSDQAQEDRARQNAQRSGDYRSGDESEEMLEQGGQNGRRLGLVDYYA
ncbi:flagellar hook-length control protein FliK [Nitrincola alkalilacustris]|uniref:flagellar hook-length control protein FliK n=1 Tax=Nitrincola alkalilacustris TaxID=1571224 RepID=UPI00124D4907|nr:flagellar hook-length control protein FliK [Nitrincola alkalilacustris]